MVGLFIVPKKLTTEEFIAKANVVHNSRYGYSNVTYINNQSKITITCKQHGNFLQRPSNHLNGFGCSRCGRKNIFNALDFISKANETHNNKYSYMNTVYSGTKTQIVITCKTHGNFTQLPSDHIRGIGCPACGVIRRSKSRKLTTYSFVDRANTVHKNNYLYSDSEYTSSNSLITITCKEHGKFAQYSETHLSGSGCQKCARASQSNLRKDTTDSFIIKANRVHEGRYDYSKSIYGKNGYSKVEIVCKKHGAFMQMSVDHLQGRGCPSCGHITSKGEQELLTFVQTLFPDTLSRDRTIIKPKELDIVIPSKKVAIEYNGLYFHSDKFPNAVLKHKEKLDSANQVGYKLIHIYEDDWLYNRNSVEHTLKHLLGVTEQRLFARKLKVKVLPQATTKAFFKAHHMQGASTGGNSLCLVDESDEIQAAMQFRMSSSERGVSDPTRWELIRYATKASIVGGASKLFKAFSSDNKEIKTIISFSDNDMFTGNMYKILGFEFVHEVSPDYKVIVDGERYHKSGFRRDKLASKYPDTFDPNLTEKENCHAMGFYRIYNSGLTKWQWSRAT